MHRSTSSTLTVSIPTWQRDYEAVLSETDPLSLFKRVEVAEAAIRTRCLELEHSLDHHSEREAIEVALRQLARIKKERLKFL